VKKFVVLLLLILLTALVIALIAAYWIFSNMPGVSNDALHFAIALAAIVGMLVAFLVSYRFYKRLVLTSQVEIHQEMRQVVRRELIPAIPLLLATVAGFYLAQSNKLDESGLVFLPALFFWYLLRRLIRNRSRG
jgi:O-antigen/teichoic acid export membrane protein